MTQNVELLSSDNDVFADAPELVATVGGDLFQQIADALDAMDEPDTGELQQLEREEETLSPPMPLQNTQTHDREMLAKADSGDYIGLYFKEVDRVPLLSYPEEVALAQRMENGQLAREELLCENIPIKRKKELQVLIEDGFSAHDHLISANVRLTITVAKKYRNHGVPFLDLIQYGNIGLIRAARKFDYHRGFKFSTVATWWIRQAIVRDIADNRNTIRVPTHKGEVMGKVLQAQHTLTQLLGRNPTPQEVADKMGIPVKKVHKLLIDMSRQPISLDELAEREEKRRGGIYEQNVESDGPLPDDAATHRIHIERIESILQKHLDPEEITVARLHWGFPEGNSIKYEEISRLTGIPLERLPVIATNARRKLRKTKIRELLVG
jgi:RNA polymerase primary sigma factor